MTVMQSNLRPQRNPTRFEAAGHTPSGATRHLPRRKPGKGFAPRFEMCACRRSTTASTTARGNPPPPPSWSATLWKRLSPDPQGRNSRCNAMKTLRVCPKCAVTLPTRRPGKSPKGAPVSSGICWARPGGDPAGARKFRRKPLRSLKTGPADATGAGARGLAVGSTAVLRLLRRGRISPQRDRHAAQVDREHQPHLPPVQLQEHAARVG